MHSKLGNVFETVNNDKLKVYLRKFNHRDINTKGILQPFFLMLTFDFSEHCIAGPEQSSERLGQVTESYFHH